ncbi:hypothetical protein ACQ4PT_040515 [Festuca glaucescens]
MAGGKGFPAGKLPVVAAHPRAAETQGGSSGGAHLLVAGGTSSATESWQSRLVQEGVRPLVPVVVAYFKGPSPGIGGGSPASSIGHGGSDQKLGAGLLSAVTQDALAAMVSPEEAERGRICSGPLVGCNRVGQGPSLRAILNGLWSNQARKASESWPRIGLEFHTPERGWRRSFAAVAEVVLGETGTKTGVGVVESLVRAVEEDGWGLAVAEGGKVWGSLVEEILSRFLSSWSSKGDSMSLEVSNRNNSSISNSKVKEHGKKEFMVKFLSAQRLEEMSNYPYFGLKGSKNVIKISKWSPAVDVFLKLTIVWGKASRVPQPFLHRDGFAEVGSLIDAFMDADMQGFRDTDVIRIKVGVRDPEKIPEMGELTDVPFVYHIQFELEQIVEEGGCLKNGVVIKNDDVDGSEANPSQEIFTKRTRNGSDDRQGGRALGNGGADSLMTDVVPSSQAETDKQMEEVLRKKMILRHAEEAKISVGDDEEEEELVDYNSSGKGDDWTGNDEEDSDEFARKVGLSTQAIKMINAEVTAELGIGDGDANSEGEEAKNAEGSLEEEEMEVGRGGED